MAETPRIVVLTPVKNEAWILDRFLATATRIADLVVIADQNSTDESAAIARRYDKVHLFSNSSAGFNEAERQVMLIQKARELVSGPKILFALDADEILAANAREQIGWQTMLAAPPGTTFYFEKPELYLNPERCIRREIPWPIAYADDGIEHRPKAIHSIRVPRPPGGRRLVLNDVKVMHYAFCRPDAQRAKTRYYAVLENVLGTQPLHRRLRKYDAVEPLRKTESTPGEWLERWERQGIDMRSIPIEEFYWHDFDVLRQFAKYGTRRFWFDDIWSQDWDLCRDVAAAKGIVDVPAGKIQGPPKAIGILRRVLRKLLRASGAG